jgi:hypothetical protein
MRKLAYHISNRALLPKTMKLQICSEYMEHMVRNCLNHILFLVYRVDVMCRVVYIDMIYHLSKSKIAYILKVSNEMELANFVVFSKSNLNISIRKVNNIT